MLQNLVPSERVHENRYTIEFIAENTAGFSFPCDANGNLDKDNMTKAAIDNYNMCINSNPEDWEIFNELHVERWSYIEPAHGTCDCGEDVVLIDEYYGACQCPKCGKWYNLFGQELRDPDEWEEPHYDDEYDW